MNTLASGSSRTFNSDNNGYIEISSISEYAFMDCAYYGTGGFRDGSFIVPHEREGFYKDRKELAVYKNYVKPVIDATVLPVFDRNVVRDVSPGANLLPIFLDDCNNMGDHLHVFMRRLMLTAVRHGVVFLVMDNFKDIPESVPEQMRGRAMPYVYMRTVNDLEEYQTDEFGKIQSITFRDRPQTVSTQDGKKSEGQQLYRRWEADSVVILKKKEKRKDGEDKWEVVETLGNSLGYIPVIPVYATERDGADLLVSPPFYAVAKMAWGIYNKDSEVRDLERAIGFAVLAMQASSVEDLAVGAHNVLMVPFDAQHMPEFVAPDMGTHEAISKSADQMREDLYSIAQQSGVTGVIQQSGVAKQWDFRSQETLLKTIATIAEEVEYQIHAMFVDYTGETSSYEVEYPNRFAPTDTGAILSDIETYVLLPGLPDAAVRMANKKATRAMFGNEDPDEVAEVLEAIDSEAMERTSSEAFDAASGE